MSILPQVSSPGTISPSPTYPPPPPAHSLATLNRFAVARQQDGLAAAIAEGPHALLAFARREQAKRDRRADAEWMEYRLVRPAGRRYWQAVENAAGVRYPCEVTAEGVKRFPTCPDQAFVDQINDALRGAGLWLRVESKHARIAFLRERARWAGDLRWVSAADGAPVEVEA